MSPSTLTAFQKNRILEWLKSMPWWEQMPFEPLCPRCEGTGECDSGAPDPQGGWILGPCECQQPPPMESTDCANWLEIYMTQGPHCYNCANRDGYPWAARPNQGCTNFKPGKPAEISFDLEPEVGEILRVNITTTCLECDAGFIINKEPGTVNYTCPECGKDNRA